MITDSARRRDGRSARTTNLRTIKSCITKLTQYTMFLKDFGEVRLSNFTDLPELNRFVYFVIDTEKPKPNLVDWLNEGENEDYETQWKRKNGVL